MASDSMTVRLRSSSVGLRALTAPRRLRNSLNVARYAAVAVICLLCDLVMPGRAGLATSAALFLFWSLWLTRHEMKGALLALNPIVCYQGWQAMTLGVAPLYIALSSPADAGIPFGNYSLTLETVAYGHAVVVVGSWAFYWGMKQFQPREAPRWAVAPAPPTGAALITAAAIGLAFHVGREFITVYTGSTVVQLGVLPLAVLCMLALNPPPAFRRSEKAQLALLLLGSLGVLVLNARRDSKMELMFSFVPLVWWALKRRKRTTLALVGLGLVVLYLGVIAPLVSLMRNAGTRDETGRLAVLTPGYTERTVDAIKTDYSSDPAMFLGTWVDATMNRMCDPCAAGMVVSLAHEGGLLYGQGLDYVPWAFIPRAVWRDKPFIDRGRNFTTVLGWAADPSVATTSTGQTSAGELYWNFGWPGVLAGMYLVGAALAGLWWRAAGPDPRRGVLEMTAYAGAMLSFVLGAGAAAGGVFVGAISAGLFWHAIIAVRDRTFRTAPLNRQRAISDSRHYHGASHPLRAPAHAGRV